MQTVFFKVFYSKSLKVKKKTAATFLRIR